MSGGVKVIYRTQLMRFREIIQLMRVRVKVHVSVWFQVMSVIMPMSLSMSMSLCTWPCPCLCPFPLPCLCFVSFSWSCSCILGVHVYIIFMRMYMFVLRFMLHAASLSKMFNPNPCGWGHIWLPKLRTGITPQWLKLRKILILTYSSKNVSWVYLVKCFRAKNGVFGEL